MIPAPDTKFGPFKVHCAAGVAFSFTPFALFLA